MRTLETHSPTCPPRLPRITKGCWSACLGQFSLAAVRLRTECHIIATLHANPAPAPSLLLSQPPPLCTMAKLRFKGEHLMLRKLLLSSVAATTMVGSALAADLPARAPPAPYVPPAPVAT